MPTPAIRNLIREDKIHQIYSSMQAGQEKLGTQTFNQSLASLVPDQAGDARSGDGRLVLKDELDQMISARRRRRAGRRPRTAPGHAASADGGRR